ncbi:hypothetical protein COCOBI_12-0350 [Coccomyxa sp. Obi]|nr:hypothetical protein COCOBI_12-0350 [Coccomyxa sp. Obi]
MDGTNISYATCFAMYNHESGILATSRYVADVQRSTSRETQLLARINGQWLPGKVLCPNELAESMGKESNLAVIKLDGDGRAPAGIPLGSASGTWAAFIAGFSNAKDKAAKFHMGEGSTLSLGMHEFGVTTPFRKSWTGGPVLDTTGHVVGVITGKKGEMTVATTAETLIFYSMVLDLEFPAYPGDSCSGEDIEYL